MSNRILLSGLLAMVLVIASEMGGAQKLPVRTSEQKAPIISASDLTKPLLKEIQDIEERTVAIAGDFPDDLYNTYRPKGDPDVRTAAQILLHVAEQNYSAASLIRTKQQQEALIAAGKVPHANDVLTFVSKQDTVEKVKGSFAAVRTAIEENPDPTKAEWWLYVIAHSNGHFGNLVTHYRKTDSCLPLRGNSNE